MQARGSLILSKELSREATTNLFVYDLDSGIPKEDLEEGLRGLFGVFGDVRSVEALAGKEKLHVQML